MMTDIPRVPDSEITPPNVYFNRRSFMRAGIAAATALATASVYRKLNPRMFISANSIPIQGLQQATESENELLARGWRVNEDKTSEDSILSYNNFYEFTTEKEGVAQAARNFKTDGWQLTDVLEWPYIEGLRLDEAMNPLTLLATGLYGKMLPPQDGAPVRLVTPWSTGSPLLHAREV